MTTASIQVIAATTKGILATGEVIIATLLIISTTTKGILATEEVILAALKVILATNNGRSDNSDFKSYRSH